MKAFALVSALLAQTPAAATAPAPAVTGKPLARNTLKEPVKEPRVVWASLSPQERASFLTGDAALPLKERLLRVSERFLGTPYVHSPLGEGSGVDPDPTFRLDAVDCLTFVEQALAMSLATAEPEVAGVLERLRYASTPTYEDRNHLMEAQWLPNNQRKGFLVDVTRRYGGEDTVKVQKTLTAVTWTSRSSLALGLPKTRQPRGTYSLDMIPLERVMAHARQVPSGTILVVLREDLPLKATRMTHLGFVVQKGKRTWLRHARRGVDGNGRVVDEDLETFLARNAKYDKWKVSGVSLYEPRRPDAGGGELVSSP
ncbi:MAG TPA: N-acetylmuramoyl-L-alanine amidase-like domain-containing protein [Archangium sp.]|uniref:N-acetylmuramoyl-L-alanine amidase-like domain-containing protein n=1 Tax=Archangium sp. TaxID=1872627 RepID=UPI002E33312B|nr:N-acetylmuramoyl-L-alanine amidase-like domain-containing protein [Archangium sp.]HEX5750077.1 N-acetylmuramoyl-L-alanine amidase-like domain-containing protein [Archangium sp.]